MITDSSSKAEILNSQFKSVFTPHSGNTFPQLLDTQCPKIKPLHILDRIDVSKSYGPDKFPGRLLQCLAKEITVICTFSAVILNNYFILKIFQPQTYSTTPYIIVYKNVSKYAGPTFQYVIMIGHSLGSACLQ